MDFIDEAKNLAVMPVPGPATPEALKKELDTLPVSALAARWCALQYSGLRDMVDEIWAEQRYFDSFPHEQPERALAFALAVLASEADISVMMQLNDRFMHALLHKHADALADRIVDEARGNMRLRWLLGGCLWFLSDDLEARLQPWADEAAWRRDEEARRTPAVPIAFDQLSAAELARAWVEQKCTPGKDQDDNWFALQDYENELLTSNPDAVIDLVLEVLKIETSGPVLGLLAAGPLEDAISMTTIERIEREAAANEAFRSLLGGVWYWNEPDPLKARLDAIVQGQHW